MAAGANRQMTIFGGHWEPILIAAGCATLVAGAGGAVSTIGPWYKSLRKPTWQPPNWLFGPAWTLIFALITAAGVIGWEATPNAESAARLLSLFGINAIANFAWSYLFFSRRRPDWALFDIAPLWLSILALIVTLAFLAKLAALLLLPYLLWVSFAGYLNYVIVRLNAPFGASTEGR